MKKTVKRKRSQKLVVVESPSKAKTISKFLGSGYKVVATVGHIRDLPKSRMGVKIEEDFEPEYINVRGKASVIKDIKKQAENASDVYLAPDPDREGEAIAWHLAYLLGISENDSCRVTFNEITKDTVKKAIKEPREINESLVDAQQGRRVLDRLVGYQISPLLWRKVRRGLSAGRVQSAALKIICDREEAIKNFVPEEYWKIFAEFNEHDGFDAELVKFKNKKIEIHNVNEAENHEKAICDGSFSISSVIKKEKKRRPYAPFTTSSLQQDAANKLNFSTKKTMSVAQKLYEGVDIPGKGTTGLISYIRTDSVRISDDAKAKAKEFIIGRYSEKYYSNNFYSNKKKDIQDAHEAIRPSDPFLTPESIQNSLTAEQYKLYRLIWTRFIASQMSSCVFDSTVVEIKNGDYIFRKTGSIKTFDGYTKVYDFADDKDSLIPDVKEGDVLTLRDKLSLEQHFTKPPARFTEASLVKFLEENNIGRPSTYAPTITTLITRNYIKREKKVLIAEELGILVNELISKYFKDIVDIEFTARMEDRLDSVEMGTLQWKDVIRDFYGGFVKELKVAESNIEKVKFEEVLAGENCPKCGKPMMIKQGRFGKFIACSGYPTCKTTKPIVKSTGVKCPKCGKEIVEKVTRKGKVFYGCSGYPKCDVAYWDKPTGEICKKCGSMMVLKGNKKTPVCSNKDCK